jgi:hypothetical protein
MICEYLTDVASVRSRIDAVQCTYHMWMCIYARAVQNNTHTSRTCLLQRNNDTMIHECAECVVCYTIGLREWVDTCMYVHAHTQTQNSRTNALNMSYLTQTGWFDWLDRSAHACTRTRAHTHAHTHTHKRTNFWRTYFEENYDKMIYKCVDLIGSYDTPCDDHEQHRVRCEYLCMYACMYVCVYIYIYDVRVCVLPWHTYTTHTHARTHTHIHAHIPTNPLGRRALKTTEFDQEIHIPTGLLGHFDHTTIYIAQKYT